MMFVNPEYAKKILSVTLLGNTVRIVFTDDTENKILCFNGEEIIDPDGTKEAGEYYDAFVDSLKDILE